jgi:nucleoside-diphosphate-sugar epimerase
VDDTVDGLIKLMNGSHIGPINIGNPNEITIKDLAEIVIRMVKITKSKIVYQDLPQDDPQKRKPDIEKANRYLGWSPKINLLEGLTKTIEYFSNLKN